MGTSRHRETRKSWGQRCEARRDELGLSQAKVGELAGLPQQTISRVELDLVVPRYGTMAALARALGTTIEQLFPVEAFPKRLREPRKTSGVRS